MEVVNRKKEQQKVNSSNYHPLRGPGMRVPQSISPVPRITKSSSLGMIEHENTDLHIVDQDDIIGLTQDVKNFSDGLVKLKAVFSEAVECDEDIKVLAHERLGDVLCTLKNVLHRYPPLNSTELFSAAGTLISKIKNYNYEDHSTQNIEQAFSDAIDQLALAFSSSVSEYLMGDLQNAGLEEEKTKSYDNLMSTSQESRGEVVEDEKEEPVIQLSPEQIDATLMSLQAGLDLAFQRAKAWSKYLKDVMTYIERRAQLEVEYSKNLSRLAVSMKPILTEEGFLPLQSVYCTVFSQDIEYSKTCQATFTLLQTSKFVEPLTTRRSEHDKARKVLKENWSKEYKKMQDTVGNLRKAQSMYITRQQEYDKAKELAQKSEYDLLSQSSGSGNLQTKVDKRKKSEEEAMHKAAEAETTYKACVAEANSRQQEILRTKANFLAAVREQILLSDQAIKKVTVEYFQLLQTVSAPVPVQYHTLCEASKRYQAGSQYAEYVRRLPVTSATSSQDDDFKFEPYHATSPRGEVQNRKTSTQSNESASSDHQSAEGSPQLPSTRRDKYRVPVKAWGQQGFAVGSDTDSASGSSKSLDSSPSNSPYPTGRRKLGHPTGSMDDLIEDDIRDPTGVKQLLAVPGTEQMDAGSLMKRHGRRRNTTFGVDFQEQVEHYHSAVPPIISKCLKEVERRGITLKGIYRVSGVKSRVESLCQRFEMDPQSVDLTSENPNVISNVLKLYLRQLPEPLLTFRLYQPFVQVAKENMSGGSTKEITIERLHDLVDKLPFSNRKTCGVLMHHLQRVASCSEQNQMTASNLGIVFGPTLLRPQGGNASLACLVDTPHQTRVVELLIISAQSLFGPRDDHDIIPAETPVEKLKEETKVPAQPPKQTADQKDETKLEPKKPLTTSSSVPLPEKHSETLLPSKSSDNLQPKPSSEEFYLPGCTNYDKKDTSGTSHCQHGEGEVPTELDSHFEDDLPDNLLPDDSLPTGNTRLLGSPRGGFVKQLDSSYSSPTLDYQQHYPTGQTLPSPASSPNLSLKSASQSVSSTPPIITVEDNSVHTSPRHVPANNWGLAGDGMSNGMSDPRSQQANRRNNTGKTQSYPQSAQLSTSPQRMRGSWPPPGTFPGESSTGDGSQALDESQSKKSTLYSRSPQLLKKWTSFDQERSKPFPSRSMMNSPMLKRKEASIDDKIPVVGSDPVGMSDSKTSRSEVSGESIESESKLVRQMTMEDRLSVLQGETATMTADPSLLLIPETEATIQLSPSVKEVSILPVHETSLNPLESEEGELLVATKLCPGEEVASPTTGAVENSSLSKQEGSDRPSQPRTVPGNGKSSVKEATKSSGKAHAGPIMGKAGLSPSKSGSDKSSKSATSSVRSALMTSAAKLKSIGKKNPVTLLSYRTESITVPSSKKSRSARLHSLPESGGFSDSARKSSQGSSKSEGARSEYADRYSITQSDSALSSSKSSQRQSSKTSSTAPVVLTVGGIRKSSLTTKTTTPSLGVAGIERSKKSTKELAKSTCTERSKSESGSRMSESEQSRTASTTETRSSVSSSKSSGSHSSSSSKQSKSRSHQKESRTTAGDKKSSSSLVQDCCHVGSHQSNDK